MPIGYILLVWLHVLLATAWIGGMVFFAAALLPVLRDPEFYRQAPRLVQKTGYRLRTLGWLTLAALIITGFIGLHYRGIGLETLGSEEFWETAFGTTLRRKLELLALLLIVGAVHDFGLGPKASRRMLESSGSPDAQSLRRWAGRLGRVVLLLSLGVLYYAVRLARGG